MNRKDLRDILKTQAPNTQLEFEHRTKEVILQFAEQVSVQLLVTATAIAVAKNRFWILTVPQKEKERDLTHIQWHEKHR
jgi:hypothetical protein